ncbi:DNA-primase RepB domain-containing protein [Rhodoferax sp.]|uniref:DNA-primase RepB domain-containing protein n=1 Tax=Rhodoferax sp. TaxID=50421 RepID=UPI00262752C0|nr:DNA-primase RepB domain-containing protein [Rhodoferax sp.]
MTLIADRPDQTVKSDETDCAISNEQFLTAVFTDLLPGESPMLVTVHGAINDKTIWPAGQALVEAIGAGNAQANNYFTLSTFLPKGKSYRRRKEQFSRAYGVMLDDVGTKALPRSRLDACPPSYMVQTSDGNYQAAYLFGTPSDDLKAVEALQEALVEAGMCDPGAKGPASRLGRLPVGINAKYDPPHQCRLVEWHPDRRYSIEDIVDRLELTPPKPKGRASTRKTSGAGQKTAGADDGVYTPRPDENEVVTALKTRGLYKAPLGSGKHDITCPWAAEHSDGVDHGSCYFEPSDISPIGGYKCLHSHGDQKRIRALLDYLEITVSAAKHKPTITVSAGELHRIADAAELELAKTKRYYQRGGLIVSVTTDPEVSETSIRPLSQPALLRALSGVAVWMRYDARSEDFVVSDPPARHVAVLFDSESYAHLPALAGIARQPHLRPDGTLVTVAGFDSPTGLFGVFDARLFNVPDHPSREDAMRALVELRVLLDEFAFANGHDESAALAAMLTAAIRPSLPTAPMFHVKAPQIASGKSYLCGIIAAFASPTSPSAIGFPASDEECQKQLLALLMAAPGCVMFDNLTTDLIPYKSLCSALTEEHLTGRILGVSKTATVGTRTLFLSSGNNVDAVRDMARRCVTINLDPKCETPATRQFKSDPLQAVRGWRENYVSLALTIIRAWIVSATPDTPCQPLASYAQWSLWVRQSLLWLGMPDPAQRVFEQLANDPDRETLGQLLHGWNRAFGDKPTAVRDAVTYALFSDNDFSQTLHEIAEERGEINRRRLGRWVSRHQGRIVDGMKFERASGTTSVERWFVKSDLTASASQPAESDELTEAEIDDFV